MASLASINIKISADLKQFSSQMQNASRSIDKIGKKMQKVGKGLSKKLTAPLVGIGVLGVKTFADFEDGMAKVKAISGATASEFKLLEENAKKLGETTRFTASEVAALQLNYSKLGFNPSEILEVTGATLDLALATGEDLANSATVAASTLRAFGLNASETNRIVDVMAASFSGSALDLQKFQVAMSTLGPVAKNAGLSIEQATAQLAVLVNAGVDATTAGTGLRNIYLDLAGSGQSYEEALSQIANSTNKNAEAFKLFGKRGATVAAVLADNYAQAQTFTENFNKAGGSAAKMAAIMDNTLKGSFLKLKSAVEGALISIGEQLAPTIKKLSESITNVVGKFSLFDDATKKTILIIAGITAAIGPLIVLLGTLLRNIATVTSAIRVLTIAIAANPIGAFAVAISAVGAALLLTNSRFSALTDSTAEFANLTNVASKNIANEKAELQKLLAVAKDETKSKQERESAIKKLNELSPKYLGDLTLETINTNKAKVATDEYVASLLKKAKVIAAEEKLVAVQKKLLDLQLGNLDAVKPSVWQNIKNGVLSTGNAYAFAALNAKTLTENIGEEYTELQKLEKALLSFISTNKKIPTPTSNTPKPTADISIPNISDALSDEDFFDEMDLSGLDKILEEAEIGSRIQHAIEDASFKSHLDKLGDELDTFVDEDLENSIIKINEKMQRLAEIGAAVGEAVGATFSDMAMQLVDSLGLADTGFQGFIKNLAATVTKLIAMMLASSISQSIAGATASGTATGPAAIFTTPAFIATAVSGVLAAFAAIPKFATGGIVSGTSYYGDKLLARVNSGELILNTRQQKALYGALQSPQTDYSYTTKQIVEGDKLILVTERAQKKKNRRS